MVSDRRRHERIEEARRHLDLTPHQLFLDYFAVGGNASAEAISDFLNGDSALGDVDYDLLATALNDEFGARGQDHPVPLADDLTDP